MKNQRPLVLGLLILLSAIFAVAVPLIWLGYGQLRSHGQVVPITLPVKFLFSGGALVILVVIWAQYFRQKRLDLAGQNEGAALGTVYKAEGWLMRLRAIIGFIGFVLLELFAVGVLLKGGPLGPPIAIFIGLIGLGALLKAYLYWRRSKSLTGGRFY